MLAVIDGFWFVAATIEQNDNVESVDTPEGALHVRENEVSAQTSSPEKPVSSNQQLEEVGDSSGAKLVTEEEYEIGRVSHIANSIVFIDLVDLAAQVSAWVYLDYAYAFGIYMAVIVVLVYVGASSFLVATNIWLSKWSDTVRESVERNEEML